MDRNKSKSSDIGIKHERHIHVNAISTTNKTKHQKSDVITVSRVVFLCVLCFAYTTNGCFNMFLMHHGHHGCITVLDLIGSLGNPWFYKLCLICLKHVHHGRITVWSVFSFCLSCSTCLCFNSDVLVFSWFLFCVIDFSLLVLLLLEMWCFICYSIFSWFCIVRSWCPFMFLMCSC